MKDKKSPGEKEISRRSFVKGAAALAAVSVVPIASDRSKIEENKIKGYVESIDLRLSYLTRPKLEVKK